MKKYLLLALFTLALTSVEASVRTPVDTRGFTVPTVDWVGAIPCGVDSSTGTNSVLCGSGAGIVYGVIASSLAATDFITFRDSATANASSIALHSVFATGTGANASGASTTQLIKLPRPIKFSNGISVTASAAPGSTRSRWTILYRPTNNVDLSDERVRPAQDRNGFSLPTVGLVGAIPCSIDASTGTNAVTCGSSGARGIVYGVVVSSVASTDFIVFRDSATTNQTSSTATIVYANGTGANATGVATQTYEFPVPIRFTNGIVINTPVAPTSATSPRWTILYRPLMANE